jgi:hypothetical protein
LVKGPGRAPCGGLAVEKKVRQSLFSFDTDSICKRYRIHVVVLRRSDADSKVGCFPMHGENSVTSRPREWYSYVGYGGISFQSNTRNSGVAGDTVDSRRGGCRATGGSKHPGNSSVHVPVSTCSWRAADSCIYFLISRVRVMVPLNPYCCSIPILVPHLLSHVSRMVAKLA